MFELSKTQQLLLNSVDKFTEDDKGQHIREFLHKVGNIVPDLPDASKIYLLRMKTADPIGNTIGAAVVAGKNYKEICKMLVERYQRNQALVWEEHSNLRMTDYRNKTLGFESKLRDLY